MPRDILSEYGPEHHSPKPARAESGGCTSARDVRAYQPPKGPTNINDPKGPGLHGDNYGNAGTQGKTSISCGESGSPGLHGQSKGHGTNRG